MSDTPESTPRTAIVTGGSRGIGRAICLELAARGMNIVFSYAGNEQAAAQTLADIEGMGARGRAVRADASSPEAAATLVSCTREEFGGVDVLVNNAGITRDKIAMRMGDEDFDEVIATNLRGAFLLSREVLRPMMRARRGRIINLSSVVALRGNAGQVNYAASKAGLIGMTKSLAREVAGRDITVNAVAPGYIETDMTAAMPEAAREAMTSGIPAGRAGTPEDVAKAVAFLASDDAAYITGEVLRVDGGMAI